MHQKRPYKINLNSNTQNSNRSGDNLNNESIETVLIKGKEIDFSSYSNLLIQNEKAAKDYKIKSAKLRSLFP